MTLSTSQVATYGERTAKTKVVAVASISSRLTESSVTMGVIMPMLSALVP